MVLVVVAMLLTTPASAERIKDLGHFQGVRGNQLTGYGIVVGLAGTGDDNLEYTTQGMHSVASRFGMNLPAGVNPALKNAAAVIITADLPAFAKPGERLDITVAAMGKAKSLRGGTLLMTPLQGADGQIYAMAQGNVAIAGAGASAGGSKTQVNQLNAGRIPSGATVERGVDNPIAQDPFVELELRDTDFSLARRVSDAVNRRFGSPLATAIDGRTIRVTPTGTDRVAFVAELEDLAVETPVPAAKVILNARTGSIVMNEAVTIDACAVAHGNLTVTIQSDPVISQPAPLSNGRTVVTERTSIDLKQEGNGFVALAAGTKLADVVRALNTLGATPQDLLAILQAMKSAGALKAELEVI